MEGGSVLSQKKTTPEHFHIYLLKNLDRVEPGFLANNMVLSCAALSVLK